MSGAAYTILFNPSLALRAHYDWVYRSVPPEVVRMMAFLSWRGVKLLLHAKVSRIVDCVRACGGSRRMLHSRVSSLHQFPGSVSRTGRAQVEASNARRASPALNAPRQAWR